MGIKCLLFGHKEPKIIYKPEPQASGIINGQPVIISSVHSGEFQFSINSDKYGMTVVSKLCSRCGLYWEIVPTDRWNKTLETPSKDDLEYRKKKLLETNNEFVMTYLRLMNLSDDDKEIVQSILKDELERNGRRS